jgi:endonuclease-8
MLVCDFVLDQRVMAGVGNEYKNEILFLEKLHPLTPIGSIDSSGRDRLAERARRLMLANAHRPFRTTTGRRTPGADAWVYGRAGQPCRRCRAEIVEASMGTPHPRQTFFCPGCQGSTPPNSAS